MTDRAVREAAARVDLVLPNETGTLSGLIGRRFPMQVVNLGDGTEIFCRGAMAIETPLHVERLSSPGERHLVDRSMAPCTSSLSKGGTMNIGQLIANNVEGTYTAFFVSALVPAVCDE